MTSKAVEDELNEQIEFLVKAAYEQGVFEGDEVAYEAMDEQNQGYALPVSQVIKEILALIQKREAEAARVAEVKVIDEWVAHVLEEVYPLDVFPKETGGGHVAGIYHGMHILRREVRKLSARDDLDFLPQETKEYYTATKNNLKGGQG